MTRFGRMGLSVALLAAGLVLQVKPALGQTSYYMTVKGQRQGQFKSETPRGGKTDEIKLTKVVYSMDVPGDPRHPSPHKPVVVTKPIGASSAQLTQAAATGEDLTEVWIYFDAKSDGKNKLVEKVRLVNAVITSMQQVNGSETISFIYQKAEVKFAGSDVTVTDDWRAP